MHAADGIRLATTGRTRRGAIAGLAAYVGGRAPHVLRPNAAATVRRRLDAGDGAGAVRHYFAAVGTRWDDEWLTVLGVDAGAEGAPPRTA